MGQAFITVLLAATLLCGFAYAESSLVDSFASWFSSITGFFSLSFSPSPSISSSPSSALVCDPLKETDHGAAYYVYGEVPLTNGGKEIDTCNGSFVVEKYCFYQNGVWEAKEYNYLCPYGCLSGACNNQTPQSASPTSPSPASSSPSPSAGNSPIASPSVSQSPNPSASSTVSSSQSPSPSSSVPVLVSPSPSENNQVPVTKPDLVPTYTPGQYTTPGLPFEFELNNPPMLLIESPLNNSEYSLPLSLNLRARAFDTDGDVTRVEFEFNGEKVVAKKTSDYIYTAQFSIVEPGTHIISAIATDNNEKSITKSVTIKTKGDSIQVQAGGKSSSQTNGFESSVTSSKSLPQMIFDAIANLFATPSATSTRVGIDVLQLPAGLQIIDRQSGQKVAQLANVRSSDPRLQGAIITKSSAADEKGFVIVENIELLGAETKTLYVERKDFASNGLCFKDEEVSSKEELLLDCIQISCPGSVGQYSCEVEGSTFAIKGLKYSGAIETTIAAQPIQISATLLAAVPKNENALCIYNSNQIISKSICDYYVSKRPGVNLLGLDIPDSAFIPDVAEHIAIRGTIQRENMSNENFITYVLRPLKSFVGSRPDLKITHLAVAKDVPARIYHGGAYISGSALLSIEADWSKGNDLDAIWQYYGGSVNFDTTYSKSAMHFDPENYRKGNYRWGYRYAVSYLAGYNFENIKNMIDKAIAPAADLSSVKWVIDRDEDQFSVHEIELLLGKAALESRGIAAANIVLDRQSIKQINIPGKIIAYAGPGTWHSNYTGGWIATDPSILGEVANRAILTSYESFNATNLTDGPATSASGQGLIADAFDPRAFGGTNYSRSFAGAFGTSDEPSLAGVTFIDDFFGAYAAGLTFGESHLSSLKHGFEGRYGGATITQFGKNLAIGDPLMRISDSSQNLVQNGEQCSNDSDCQSGNCDANEKGVKVCHIGSFSCPTSELVQVWSGELYQGASFTVFNEVQNAGSFCTPTGKIISCSNSLWQEPISCPENNSCSIIRDSVNPINVSASCALINGSLCTENSQCASGVCGLDISGANKCKAAGNSCIGIGGYQTLNGNFSCMDDKRRAQCVNGEWYPAQTCTASCVNGACSEDYFSKDSFSLKAEKKYHLVLTKNVASKKIKDIFPSAPFGTTLQIKKNGADFVATAVGEWGPEGAGDIEIAPGQGFIITPGSDYSFSFQGLSFSAPVSVRINGGYSLIGIPYCADKYNVSSVSEEIRRIEPRCNLMLAGDVGSEASPWWSYDLLQSSPGRRTDFAIKNYEPFWVKCEQGQGSPIDFSYVPLCPAAGDFEQKTFVMGDISFVQNASGTSILKSGKQVMSLPYVQDPVLFRGLSIDGVSSISQTSTSSLPSFIILKNFPRVLALNKVVSFEKKIASSNAVCVNESENVSSPEDILQSCSVIKCPGSSGPYSCAIEAGKFSVSGPNPLGIVEYTIEPPRNANPAIELLFPSNNSSFIVPASIRFEARAADADGAISRVEFYNGANLIATDTSEPYLFNWENVQEGIYRISAKAIDNQGAVSISSESQINVIAPNSPPHSAIISPVEGSVFESSSSSTILISANATDSGAISKVEFYSGQLKLGEALVAPYSFSWANVGAGEYSISARAIDNEGSAADSAPIRFRVVAQNRAPIVTITSPLNGANFISTESIIINANASDSDGSVAKVEFYNGASLIGSDISAPYSFNYPNAQIGQYTIVVKAFDNQGSSSASSVNIAIVEPANIAPTISITAQGPAQLIFPTSIVLIASAQDADGTVANVQFYSGESLLGSDSTAPYSFSWENIAVGSYSITAQAIDNRGAVVTSQPLNIVVSSPSNSPPSVAILSPATNSVFDSLASFEINASASDTDGSVSKVEFFRGSEKIGEDLSSENGWKFTLASLTSGTYEFYAKATDEKGASASSAAITVTIREPALQRKTQLGFSDLDFSALQSGVVLRQKGFDAKLVALSNISDATGKVQNISIKRSEQSEQKQYIIISGLSLLPNEAKTVYLEKSDPSSNGVCVKDSEVSSKQQILDSCIDILCPGSNSSYSCSLEGSVFAVSGLSNSGVVEKIISVQQQEQVQNNTPPTQAPSGTSSAPSSSTSSSSSSSGGGAPGVSTASATGSEGYKAAITGFDVQTPSLSQSSEISALVSHGFTISSPFEVEVEIIKGGSRVFVAREKTSLLSPGRAHKILFSNKWTPSEKGNYIVTMTLYSSNRDRKYDTKTKNITLGAIFAAPPSVQRQPESNVKSPSLPSKSPEALENPSNQNQPFDLSFISSLIGGHDPIVVIGAGALIVFAAVIALVLRP